MDKDVEIMHVINNKLPASKTEVKVNLSTEFNRQTQSPTLSMPGLSIDDIWAKRLVANPRLFNGTKFRIHNIKGCESEGYAVEFCLGVTDYKEYLGTNWSPKVDELREEGNKRFNNSQAFLSDALGVGAFVVTQDGCMMLQRRSQHLAEASGLWDVPGGHAEPNEIVGDIPLEAIDVNSMKPEAVAEEIFSSIQREVVDEVNIPADCLEPAMYLGTAKNTTSAGRPSMVFEIKTSLSSEEVKSRYNQGVQSEADESTNITFVPVEKMAKLQIEDPDFWSTLAPSAKGNITVYCLAYGLRTFGV